MQPPELFRTKLRAAVTDVLMPLEEFGGHVYNMRGPVMRRNLLPAVRIFVLTDNRTPQSETHPVDVYDGRLTLRVQVIVENGSDPRVADRLDWLCWVAETALLSDAKLRTALRFKIMGIDTSIDLDVQGELRTATATLDYDVQYADCFELYLPDEFKRLRMRLDFIDPPADPNTGPWGTPPNVEGGYHGGHPGPDGRIETGVEWSVAQSDPADSTAAPPWWRELADAVFGRSGR